MEKMKCPGCGTKVEFDKYPQRTDPKGWCDCNKEAPYKFVTDDPEWDRFIDKKLDILKRKYK